MAEKNMDLTLEKINADRITQLEGKIDALPEKIMESVKTLIDAKSNGNGKRSSASGLEKTVVVLLVTLVCTLIANVGTNLFAHSSLFGHPHMMEKASRIDSTVTSINGLVASNTNAIKSVSDLSKVLADRQAIHEKEVAALNATQTANIARNKEWLDFIKRLFVDHILGKGHLDTKVRLGEDARNISKAEMAIEKIFGIITEGKQQPMLTPMVHNPNADPSMFRQGNTNQGFLESLGKESQMPKETKG